LLAQGVVPYANWANVFANPKLAEWPNLQGKAFHVWFPTMLDYLSGRVEARAIEKELSARKEACENVFELSERLGKCFEGILSMYSIEEQILIRDRRLQNVHGKLQINMFEKHKIKVYDSKITQREFSSQKYRDVVLPFYNDLSRHSGEFIKRLLESEIFCELTELYTNNLLIEKHLMPLISRLGVPAIAGNG
jgi:hypothetical protein